MDQLVKNHEKPSLFSIVLGEGFWGTAWADTSLLGQELQ